MFRRLLAASLLCVATPTLYAQSDFSIRWDASPKVHSIPEAFSKESAVFVLLQRRMEYRPEGKELYVYRTIHHIIHPVDERGLEAFNTFTIPIGQDREITSVMARTILPGGKVIEVGRDKVKRAKNEEGYEEYLIALEGLTKGAEVELLYTEKRPLSLFGVERLQFGLPIMRAEFSLISPTRLRFQTKGYNGFPSAKDTVINRYHHYTAAASNLPAVDDEPYSNMEAGLQKLAYRLSYATGEGGLESPRQFTWDDLVRDMYKTYYMVPEKQKKVVARYLESIGVNSNMSAVQKIQTIEEAMKTGISMSESLDGEAYEDFENIVKKKVTTERGFVRLMMACLLQAGIDCDLGLSSNRFSDPVDEDFEVWSILDQYVLYFPRLKTYLSPSAINFRYPFIPFNVRGNKGIFCSREVGYNLNSAMIASVRSIPALPMENTKSNISGVVRFSAEDLTPTVDITHSFQGYSALGLREAFVFSARDKEKELVSGIIDLGDQKEDVLSYKVENAAFSSYNDNKPLNLTASVRAPKLLEKAGNRYLFRVGELIGQQVEMYNDEKRLLPIDIQYSHSFQRKIRVEVPKGYKITNPEGVRMNVVHQDAQGKRLMGFVSDYTLEGSTMTITVDEFYDATHLPVSDYPVFRKIINAAADFNKVVLVLQK